MCLRKSDRFSRAGPVTAGSPCRGLTPLCKQTRGLTVLGTARRGQDGAIKTRMIQQTSRFIALADRTTRKCWGDFFGSKREVLNSSLKRPCRLKKKKCNASSTGSVSHWILTSCQRHRITAGRSNCHNTHFKTVLLCKATLVKSAKSIRTRLNQRPGVGV